VLYYYHCRRRRCRESYLVPAAVIQCVPSARATDLQPQRLRTYTWYTVLFTVHRDVQYSKLPGGPPMMSTTGQRAVHKCWYTNTRQCLYIRECVCVYVCMSVLSVYTKQTSPGTEATQKRTPPHSSECRKQPDGPAMTTTRPPKAIYDFLISVPTLRCAGVYNM